MSMKRVSETSSGIIGSAVAKLERTGQQATAIGSAKPQSFPRPVHPAVQADPLQELPRLVRSIVPVGTALLISFLRFSGEPLPDQYVVRAIAALERLGTEHEKLRTPAPPIEIIDALTMIASAIQVELPEEDGLFVYVTVLQGAPGFVLKEAMLEVMKTHTYRTLPLPAEILKARPAIEWTNTDRWMLGFLKTNLQSLRRRAQTAQLQLTSTGEDNG